MCDVIWNSFLGKKGKLVLEEHFAADLYALHVLGKGIYKWHLEWSIYFTESSQKVNN